MCTMHPFTLKLQEGQFSKFFSAGCFTVNPQHSWLWGLCLPPPSAATFLQQSKEFAWQSFDSGTACFWKQDSGKDL